MRRKNEPLFSRVFFIGAGFSAAMFYPVGRTLMADLVRYLRRKPAHAELQEYDFENVLKTQPVYRKRGDQIVEVIAGVLAKYFATDLEGIGQVDVAEFFTMAHTLAETPLLFGPGKLPEPGGAPDGDEEPPSELTLFQDLAAVTRTYFNAIGELREPPDDIQAILRKIRPEQDAVINFNWDEEVDIALSQERRPGVRYTLAAWRADPRRMLTLKPHGSIGWYDVRLGIGNDDAYFIADSDGRVPRSKKRVLAYEENELPLDIDGSPHSPLACPPVIMPPTFAKRFEYLEQQCIWQDVLTVCSQAREFIFLGYSLPKDDFLTRAAIRSALRENKEADQLKCLVVDLSFDPPKDVNFRSVFQGLVEANNFLQWRFGSDGDFLDVFEAKLEKARLLTYPK